MFGALLAHYYTEPDSFFGIKWIHDLLPFNIAKGYHLQLAIFWIAAKPLQDVVPAGGRKTNRKASDNLVA